MDGTLVGRLPLGNYVTLNLDTFWPCVEHLVQEYGLTWDGLTTDVKPRPVLSCKKDPNKQPIAIHLLGPDGSDAVFRIKNGRVIVESLVPNSLSPRFKMTSMLDICRVLREKRVHFTGNSGALARQMVRSLLDKSVVIGYTPPSVGISRKLLHRMMKRPYVGCKYPVDRIEGPPLDLLRYDFKSMYPSIAVEFELYGEVVDETDDPHKLRGWWDADRLCLLSCRHDGPTRLGWMELVQPDEKGDGTSVHDLRTWKNLQKIFPETEFYPVEGCLFNPMGRELGTLMKMCLDRRRTSHSVESPLWKLAANSFLGTLCQGSDHSPWLMTTETAMTERLERHPNKQKFVCDEYSEGDFVAAARMTGVRVYELYPEHRYLPFDEHTMEDEAVAYAKQHVSHFTTCYPCIIDLCKAKMLSAILYCGGDFAYLKTDEIVTRHKMPCAANQPGRLQYKGTITHMVTTEGSYEFEGTDHNGIYKKSRKWGV